MKKQDYATAVIFDKNKKLLIQKRDKYTNVYPEYWGLFGGKIEKGENEKEAIIREIKEEINHDIVSPKFLYHIDYIIKNISFGIWYVFVEKISEEDKNNLKLLEGDDWGWFSFEEIKKLKINEDMRNVIERVWKIIDIE